MKKIVSCLLAFALCLGLCACSEDSAPVSPNGNETTGNPDTATPSGNTEDDTNYTAELIFEPGDDLASYRVAGISGIPQRTDIVIPATYQGYPVTEIKNGAFKGLGITSISIPDSVTIIGASAFSGCERLQYNIYGGAKYVGNENNPYRFLVAPETKEGSTIEVHPDVFTILPQAFNACSGPTSVILPEGMTSIPPQAFELCTGLTSITIPDSVTSIGYSAFFNCENLKSVILPDGVTDIGYCAFHCCYSMTDITIPDSVTSIGNSAFLGCISLSDINIPDSVTYIGEGAFSQCKNLTNITISDSVTHIGECAFYGCESITSITIPGSVTSIGDIVFDGCFSLTDIYFGGTMAEWEALGYDYWGAVHCADGDISK